MAGRGQSSRRQTEGDDRPQIERQTAGRKRHHWSGKRQQVGHRKAEGNDQAQADRCKAPVSTGRRCQPYASILQPAQSSRTLRVPKQSGGAPGASPGQLHRPALAPRSCACLPCAAQRASVVPQLWHLPPPPLGCRHCWLALFVCHV